MENPGAMASPQRWGLVYSLCCWLFLCLQFAAPPVSGAEERHPLAPVDTSSPRTTLLGFLEQVDRHWEIFRDQYRHSPSKQLDQELATIAAKAIRTLDLSEIAPSAQTEVGYDAATFMYDTLSRIELPPVDEIPDSAVFEEAEEDAEWTIPNTEITIARVDTGLHEGEFLFSPDTVARAREFHQKARGLPYRRDVAIENTPTLRNIGPGWWLSMSTIEGLPGWLNSIFLEQAVWKWIVFSLLLIMAFTVAFLVHRVTWSDVHENTIRDYLQRLALPIFLLLVTPVVSYIAIQQVNLIGSVSQFVLLTAETIQYLVATWLAWLASLLVAELAILSPRIQHNSLKAQLLRLTARITGIIIGFVIIFYGASQIGIPLLGVLAGVGVGGLAIALAAQDSLKNLLGSLTIFMDQPYAPGQRIVVQGHDGFVEEIGLRSTKIRLLNGALASLPNEKMANLDIENIGRRQFIRRRTNIRLAYNTPSEKIKKAVDIIRTILDNHEGMRPELPPRVYFDEFNPDSLSILVMYWYHPPRRWKALQFDEQVNLKIAERFEEEGIQFAIPAYRVYLPPDGKSARTSTAKDATDMRGS